MSAFKDLIKKDINAVFFNPDEFSEQHTIDGKAMNVIIDSLELLERDKAKAQNHQEGLYKSQLLIYVQAAEYGPRPAIGKIIILDGKKRYKITDVADENGVYSLTLEVNKA